MPVPTGSSSYPNYRSYSGPTTGGAFDTRTIPDSQGGGNLGVMSFQFSQNQQQAGWDAMNSAPGYFVVPVFSGNNGIAELPGPLLNEYNSWMTELTPEAQQDVDYLLYGDLSDLTTSDTGVLFAGVDAADPTLWAEAVAAAKAGEQYITTVVDWGGGTVFKSVWDTGYTTAAGVLTGAWGPFMKFVDGVFVAGPESELGAASLGVMGTIGVGFGIGMATNFLINSIASRNFSEAALAMQEQAAINDTYVRSSGP